MSPAPEHRSGGLPFVKMSAAGNDFVVVEAGHLPQSPELPDLVRRICRRRMSVGADGVISVQRVGPDRLRVAFFNPDGEETFCGNGARCAARYGVVRAGTAPRVVLETERGSLRADVGPDRVCLEMGECRVVRKEMLLKLDSGPIRAALLQVGVPHLVTFDLDPDTVDVEGYGRLLRSHPEVGPLGANVNFVRRTAAGVLTVRTFERGVEGETLSCGTGCVAAVLADALRGNGGSPTTCRTRSGSGREVNYVTAGGGFEAVSLAGEARLVYSASLDPEA
jgi:diaminopimelate epimerase